MADMLCESLTISQEPDTLSRLVRTLSLWRRRARERAQLLRLGDRELRDIGLTPADAAFLASKPFWRE